MKRDKAALVKNLYEFADEYQEHFLNKKFAFVYQVGDEISVREVVFNDYHFLHLIGVVTRLNAKQFYSACIQRRLAESDISLKGDGTTIQKLKAFPFMKSLLYGASLIGDYLHTGYMLKCEYCIGEMRAQISVGFNEAASGVGFPVTLLNSNIKQRVHHPHRVVFVLCADPPYDKYKNALYAVKDIDIFSLALDIDITELVMQQRR